MVNPLRKRRNAKGKRERERVDLKIDQKTKFRSVKHAREIRNISIGEGGKGGGGYLGEED